MHKDAPLSVSIVIPVYRGEHSLPALLKEIDAVREPKPASEGAMFRIAEVILVHDCGPDNSHMTMQKLAKEYPFVKPIWFSRNFGQHPATIAGMANTTGEWIVTMDEDGMHDPKDIGALISHALRTGTSVVYAQPTNKPPHGWLRNTASNTAKWILQHILGNRDVRYFSSFRLVRGEIGRSLAAYCGHSVFLDVALAWITGRSECCQVRFRSEGTRPSGYSLKRLMEHFWRLLITAGTKPLRAITLLGFASIIIAFALAVYAVWAKFLHQVPVQGWTSLVIVVAFFSGSILFALGLIAEYLAVAVGIVMGKPLYITTSRPEPSTHNS